MTYKCIAEYSINGETIMKPGDVILANDKIFYNITSGICCFNFTKFDEIKPYLKSSDKSQLTTEESDSQLAIKESDVLNEGASEKTTESIITPESFDNIISKLSEIFKKKNHDYGNSFEQSLNEEGLAAARIRMGDKWNRFKNLSLNDDIKVSDESLRDTLLDLANYAIMTVIWMDNK